MSRIFFRDIINHCYQRSADGGVIFYTEWDYLVWFTTVCTTAIKYKVQILAMCPMPDHTHFSVVARTRKDLSGFMGVYTHDFSRAYNTAFHLKGPLFKHSFGSAPKVGAKKARTNLIYVNNNAVERQLAVTAEKYRWSFVAYAASDHPFSEKLIVRQSSRALYSAIKEIKFCRKRGRPLNYKQLSRLFGPLNKLEREQLIDYIIVQYNVIDYAAALAFFDHSYEHYLTALHATIGSEYDLNEVFIGKSDKHYDTLTNLLLQNKRYSDIHEMLSLDHDGKQELFHYLRGATSVMGAQIAKYIHLLQRT